MAVNTNSWDPDGEWEVELIVGHRNIDARTGFPKEFLIKWKDWLDGFNSFEPLSNLNCLDILRDYLKAHQVDEDEAASLRSTLARAPRKHISVPPSGRGRSAASGKPHICEYRTTSGKGHKTCTKPMLFCSMDIEGDGYDNIIVRHGSRGLPASSKSSTEPSKSTKKKDSRKKRAVTPKEDKATKRRCAERKTRRDKSVEEREFFQKKQQQPSKSDRKESRRDVDKSERLSDSSDVDLDDGSVDLDIPEVQTMEKPKKIAIPTSATPKPVAPSQSTASTSQRRVVSRLDRFKRPERLSDFSRASSKSSGRSSAKSSNTSSKRASRKSATKSPVKSPGLSPLEAKRRLFSSNLKVTPPRQDSRSISPRPISTADRPRLILKVPNPKKDHRKAQNRSRSGSLSSLTSSLGLPKYPTPPRTSARSARPKISKPSRASTRSARPRSLSRSLSGSLSRSISPEIRATPVTPPADTSRLNNGVSLSALAKLAHERSKSVLPRKQSRAQGYDKHMALRPELPAAINRSKSVMVHKPSKRPVSSPDSSPERVPRPSKAQFNHRAQPTNKQARASAQPSTRRERR